MAVLLGATAVGFYRWVEFPLERDHLMIVAVWHLVNIILATGAFGVMFERARPQVAGAIPRSKPVNLVTTQGAVRATLIETTIEKGRLLIEGGAHMAGIASGKGALQVVVPGRADISNLPILIQGVGTTGSGAVLDIKYMPRDADDDGDLVRLCYGDSAVWVAFQQGRQKRVPVLFGMLTLFMRGLKRSLAMAGAGRPSRRAATVGAAPLNQPAQP
jgi:cellulose synthase (UDP-forming)